MATFRMAWSADHRRRVRRKVVDTYHRPEVAALVRSHGPAVSDLYAGGRPGGIEGYPGLITAAASVSMDTRKGAERWNATVPDYTDDQVALIHLVASKWGMLGSEARKGLEPGLLMGLGARAHVSARRTAELKRTLDEPSNGVPKYIVLAGSERPLDEKYDERTQMRDYLLTQGVDVGRADRLTRHMKTEFDTKVVSAMVLLGATKSAADQVGQDAGDHTPWRIRTMRTPDDRLPDVVVISAPSSRPGMRANTGDTYNFVRRIPGVELSPDLPVTAVTTRIYRPFQEADLLNRLGHLVGDIDVIGYSRFDPEDLASPETIFNTKPIGKVLDARPSKEQAAIDPEANHLRYEHNKIAADYAREILSGIRQTNLLHDNLLVDLQAELTGTPELIAKSGSAVGLA